MSSAMDNVSNPSLFSKFRIVKRPKPQNYPIQNKVLYRHGNKDFKRKHGGLSCYSIVPKESSKLVSVCGPLASKWIAEHLADILDQVVTFNPETLRDACLEADAQLLKELPEADIHGSTAVFAVVTKEEGSVKDEGESDEDDGSGESEKQVSWLVQCCNLGDSRLLLANYETGEVIQQEKESERIKKAGGFIARNRIDACLAVSRAFGDGSYKTNEDLGPTEQKVSPEPDVFEAMTNDEALNFVRERIVQGETDTAQILSLLVQKVLEGGSLGGSRDNMTAMVIELKDGTDYASEESEFVVGEWYEGGNDGYKAAFNENCRWYGKDPEAIQKQWLAKKGGLSLSDESSDDVSASVSIESSQKSIGRSSKKRAQHRKKKGSDSEETKTSPRKSPKSSRKGGNDKDKDNEMTEKTKEKEEDSKKSMTLASFVVKFGGQCAAAAILEANGIVHIVEGNGKKK